MEKNKNKIPTEGKITFGIFAVVIIAWILPIFGESFLPAVNSTLNRLGNAVPPMLGICALCLIRVKGKPIVDLAEISTRIPWKLEFFFMTITATSGYIGSEATGIRTFLMNVMEPITGSMSPFVFLIFVCVGCVILTNFVSNAVAMTVFFYIGAFALSEMMSPVTLGFLLAAIANLSVLIAPSCIYSAYIFGNDYLEVKSTLKINIIYIIVSVALILALIYPLGGMIWPA